MKKEEQTILIEILGKSPKIRIINFLLDFPFNDFTKQEIINALGINKNAFYKNFEILIKYNLVIPTRKIGKAILYKINLNHPLIKKIKEIEKILSKPREKEVLIK